MSENYFKELAAVDCAEHIEKKGQFSYLSWAWAVHYVGVKYPDWSFNVKRFGENQTPYMKTELGFFVEVEVTISGSTKSEIMPVLDNRNKPIAQPTTFDINNSHKRCLVKAIALHGLGLYIYNGEDLPSDDVRPAFTEAEYKQYHECIAAGDALGFLELMLTLAEEAKDALHNSFEAGQISKGKQAARDLEKLAHERVKEYADNINTYAASEDASGVNENRAELEEFNKVKKLVWRELSETAQLFIKNLAA